MASHHIPFFTTSWCYVISWKPSAPSSPLPSYWNLSSSGISCVVCVTAGAKFIGAPTSRSTSPVESPSFSESTRRGFPFQPKKVFDLRRSRVSSSCVGMHILRPGQTDHFKIFPSSSVYFELFWLFVFVCVFLHTFVMLVTSLLVARKFIHIITVIWICETFSKIHKFHASALHNFLWPGIIPRWLDSPHVSWKGRQCISSNSI